MPQLRGAMRGFLLACLAVTLAAVFAVSPGGWGRITPALASGPADEGVTLDEGVTPDAFIGVLIGALFSRNEAGLQSMMGTPFVWATWQGVGEEMAPEDAAARLQDELLAPAQRLVFVAPIVVDEWMRGVDPLTIWPPDVRVASVVGVGGLGAGGEDEAILVIAQDLDGAFYWYGLLAATGGFADQSGDPPAVIELREAQTGETILPSDVRQVLVLGAVGIFDGPGSQYNQVGTAVRGQSFPVLGASADGQWWAVTCAQVTAACWISANPTFVRPQVISRPVTPPTPAPLPPTPLPPTPLPPAPTVRPTLPPPRPTARPTVAPPVQRERIQFAPGQERAVRSGPLWAHTAKQFVFGAAAGQFPTIRLSSPSPAANFGVVGMADGVIYKAQGDMQREWTFAAPRGQDYLITILAPVNTSYTLELIIPRPGPPPTPTVQPTGQPTATPTIAPPGPAERISFAAGQDSAVRSGPLAANQYKRYVFKGSAEQVATIVVSSPSPSAYFTIVGVADGIPYKSMGSSAMSFTFTLPATQDYLISIAASVNTSYSLVLTIPPLVGPTATATATTSPTSTPLPTAEPTLLPTPEPSATATEAPPTATATEIPPTATATDVPPTATATEVPPTATATEVPPTATATATATDVPPTTTPGSTPEPVPPDPVGED